MKKCRTLLLIALFVSNLALAARPLVTDDARLTKAGSCQVESWGRTHATGNEFWALPACNPFGNFEMTLGTAISAVDQQQPASDLIVQAKTIVKELTTNGWGIGFAMGVAKHQGDNVPGPNGVGSTYAYVPFSRSFSDDQLIMHINLGYISFRKSSQDSLTWGIGSEYKLHPKLLHVLEIYGDHRASPFIQTGLRYSIVPDILQVDTTVGKQLNGNDIQWLSIGVRYTPDRLF